MPQPHSLRDQCACGDRKDARAARCRKCFTAATPEEVAFLRANIDRLSWTELGARLERKTAAVRGTAARYGIVKSAAAAREGMRRNRWGDLSATERYWTHVIKGDGCWGWNGSVDGNGYGVFGTDNKTHKAHRFSYELHNGPIPAGESVLHTCDNPPCSRPDHLFTGSQAVNMADASAKMRVEYGERHHAAKLTCAVVVSARARHAAGEGIVDLAREFGVSRATLTHAIHRKTWRHVA